MEIENKEHDKSSSTSSSEKEGSECEQEKGESNKKWQEPDYMSVKIPDDVDQSMMTKKQIRKLQKTIYWESKLPEMRAKHRQNLKLKRQIKKEQIAIQLQEGSEVNLQDFPGYAHGASKNFKLKFKEELKNSQPIIVDCAFENLHYVKDMKSLGNQFSQLLGINRKLADITRGELDDPNVARRAFNIYITGLPNNQDQIEYPQNIPSLSVSGLNSKQRKKLEKKEKKNGEGYKLPEDGIIRIGAENWQSVNFGAKGKLRKYLQGRDAENWLLNLVENKFDDLPFIEGAACFGRSSDEPITGENVPYLGGKTWKREDLIYLTGDAEEVMEEFDHKQSLSSGLIFSKIYIIGGLVDHNAFKNFTLGYALSQGIKVQRFPINENIKIKDRTILTVNQSFEIMQRKLMGYSWKKALEDTIPCRKWATEEEEAKTGENTLIQTEDIQENKF